jgi:hypothetical protein
MATVDNRLCRLERTRRTADAEPEVCAVHIFEPLEDGALRLAEVFDLRTNEHWYVSADGGKTLAPQAEPAGEPIIFGGEV